MDSQVTYLMWAVALLCLVAWGARGDGNAPTAAEMNDLRQWVRANIEGDASPLAVVPGLTVVENHGPVHLNSRGGAPMRLGGEMLRSGLYCHAPSRIQVVLDRPAASLRARLGVDSNDQTSGGRGSVVFRVVATGMDLWSSPVLREGAPPLDLDLPLGGRAEFEMVVEDGGDGIACDQADWADAVIVLADGSELPLGNLPISGAETPPQALPAPFSFTYGGQPSSELLGGWAVERAAAAIEDPRHGTRTQHTVTFTDPDTRLAVRMLAIEYRDFPVVEWTLHLTNEGAEDTPIIADLQAMDLSFSRSPHSEFSLHRIRGDDCSDHSYEPLDQALAPEESVSVACAGGRPTQFEFPYLNLEWDGRGAIVALGWPGQWRMSLERDAGQRLRVSGGQEGASFVLHPGESVRSPLVVLQFYHGQWLRAQNVWRRWMLAHNLPMPGGMPLEPLRSLCTGNYYPGLMTEVTQEKEFLRRHIEAGVEFDVWWQDAGWYPCDDIGWPKVGTWEPDLGRFPNGLREISDLVHGWGKRSMVWFEPERVHAGTWIAEQHPEWVHGGAEGGLLRLDLPECRQWLTDHIDGLLTREGIDYYRQDFNIDPLPYWQAADAEDRQGITEIRHVEGYLAFWDELLARHPNMLIDSCASGGRRNDLETLRRAVPLLRSDWYWSPEGQQCLTQGLSLWVPYQGTGVIYDHDEYWWRSSMASELSFGPDAAGLDRVDLHKVAQMVAIHRQVAPYYLGDFYPLTPYGHSTADWHVRQFDRPGAAAGLVEAFRRPQSIYESARVPLRGLEPAAVYELSCLETCEQWEASGADLLREGVRLEIDTRPGIRTVIYRRLD